MFVTLYTDASVKRDINNRTKIAASWAIWARSTKGRILYSSLCPSGMTDANCAEHYAALKGIEIIISTWEETKRILIKSDSQSLIDFLQTKRFSKRRDIADIQKEILSLIHVNQLYIVSKKVKSHSDDKTMVAYLNRRVDKLAKQELRSLGDQQNVRTEPTSN